jgi:hypothetical protein
MYMHKKIYMKPNSRFRIANKALGRKCKIKGRFHPLLLHYSEVRVPDSLGYHFRLRRPSFKMTIILKIYILVSHNTTNNFCLKAEYNHTLRYC